MLELSSAVEEFLREHRIQLRRRRGSEATPSPPPPRGGASTGTETDDEYQAIVDQALQLIYSQVYRLLSRLYPPAVPPLSLEHLREGPLGDDLRRLVQVAVGTLRPEREEVLGAIASILQLLFWPVGAEFYVIPRSFWETPLGKVLSLAKLRAFESNELISIGEAAEALGVTPPTIYRWMDEGLLDWVRDDRNVRTLVVREDVEALKAEIEADAARDERRDEANVAELLEAGIEADAARDERRDEAAGAEEPRPSRSETFAPRKVRDESAATPEVALPSDGSTIISLRIAEEPLTAHNLETTLSALTGLHTKCWLNHQGRYADLIDYAQTRNTRSAQEANLIITKITQNSPVDLRLDVGLASIGDAIRTAIDAVVLTPHRIKEAKLKNRASESEAQQKERAAQAALADQEQARQLAAERAALELERERLAVQRERLALEHERVKSALDTAMVMVERLHPNAVEPVTKAMLAQTLVPQLLQLGGSSGVELALPAPEDKPSTPPQGNPRA